LIYRFKSKFSGTLQQLIIILKRFYLTTTEANERSFDDLSRILINKKYLKKKSGLDIKSKSKVAGFVGTNQKKKDKNNKKRINSLPAKHAIGNIKANTISKQKRSLRINYLRPMGTSL
jgi:hypothetical protein